MRREIRRTEEEAAVYTDHGGLDTWRQRAYDEEDLDAATVRILLERGVTPYRIGKTANPDLDTGDISETADKVAAQLARTNHLARLGELRDASRVLADLAAGGQFFSRWAPLTPERIQKEISRLDDLIAKLSPRSAS